MTIVEENKTCRPVGGWTVVVPTTFAEIDNGDSWQAHEAARCVYVSSLVVTGPMGAAPAAALFATASKRLAADADSDSFEERGLYASAQISETASGFELKGFTCVDGHVATCVISFAAPTDRDWAIATWKSLRFEPTPKPWWRFW